MNKHFLTLEKDQSCAHRPLPGLSVDRMLPGLSGDRMSPGLPGDGKTCSSCAGRIEYGFLTRLRFLPAIMALMSMTVLSYCNNGPLEVQASLFCPDYSAQDDACQNLHFEDVEDSDNTIMARFSESRFAGIKTWKEWNHYIYFEEPITVGFLLRWNRPAGLEERSSLRNDLRCVYTISHPETQVSIRGELEGKRLESGGLWCFNYLGTLLGELQKQEGVLKRIPDPNYFPVDLKLEVESSKKHLRREVTRRILVYWR